MTAFPKADIQNVHLAIEPMFAIGRKQTFLEFILAHPQVLREKNAVRI